MNKGTLYGAIAYILWGFFPIYFKLLTAVPSFQITAHRVVWSCVFVLVLVALRGELNELRAVSTKRTLLIYLGAGLLLGSNWAIYVWAVNANLLIETSLGYFMTPLIIVVLGMIFLGERLRVMQWIPVILAGLSVIYLTASYGSLPWVALSLAVTFGLYGLVKKTAPLGSLHGLTLETTTIFLPALGYLLFVESRGIGSFGHLGWGISILLALTGVVTAVPLLLFAVGARSIPMTTLGLLQYIAPSLQFILGVFLYKEPFTTAQLIGFIVIWLALVIYTADSYRMMRINQAARAAS